MFIKQFNTTTSMIVTGVFLLAFSSCGESDVKHYSFKTSQEAVAQCHKELSKLKKCEEAGIKKLAFFTKSWMTLKDSTNSVMGKDTTILSNMALISDFYKVSDSIRSEIERIAMKQTRSLRDVVYLKVNGSSNRAAMLQKEDFKKAQKFFKSIDEIAVYKDLPAALHAYSALLSNTRPFEKAQDVMNYISKEDVCFRSLLAFLPKAPQDSVTSFSKKTNKIFDDLRNRVERSDGNQLSMKTLMYITMRYNRRVIQNAQTCMENIDDKVKLNELQKGNYRWMLIQPYMIIDDYAASCLTPQQVELLLKGADDLPKYLSAVGHADQAETKKMIDKVTQFFLRSFLVTSL